MNTIKEYFPNREKNIESIEKNRIDQLKELLNKGAGIGTIATSLSFCDSVDDWNLRRQLQNLAEEKGKDKKISLEADLMVGLGGLDNDESWNWRDKYIKNEYADLNSLALSVMSLDSEKSYQLRNNIIKQLNEKEISERQTIIKNLFLSLIGLNSEKSWEMRKYLLETGGSPRDYVLSMIGLDNEDERIKKYKNKFYGLAYQQDGGEINNTLLLSSLGQNDKFSKELRSKFISEKGDKNYLLDSLATDNSKEADEIRQKYINQFHNINDSFERQNLGLHLALSSAGLKNKEIEEILDNNKYHNEKVYYLCGDILSSYLIKKKKN
jgi:hypothetical protein